MCVSVLLLSAVNTGLSNKRNVDEIFRVEASTILSRHQTRRQREHQIQHKEKMESLCRITQGIMTTTQQQKVRRNSKRDLRSKSRQKSSTDGVGGPQSEKMEDGRVKTSSN